MVEFALVRARPSALKSGDDRGKWGAVTALVLLKRLDYSLSSVQLGSTCVSLLIGWLGISCLSSSLLEGMQLIGIDPHWEASAKEAFSIGIALLLLVFIHVSIAEFFAKSLAIRYPETVLRIFGGTILVLSRLGSPLVALNRFFAELLLKSFGVAIDSGIERAHTSEELAFLISRSRGPDLDKEEEEMIHGVFSFSDTVAREVMTPRTDVVTIPLTASLEEIVNIIQTSGFSRFPVTGNNRDDIRGMVLAKDLLEPLSHWMKSGHSEDEFRVEAIMREAYFIPSTKPIDDLLSEFKSRKEHLAIALDEHGGVDGIVTLEDLLEEIVGDIFDESDVAERDVVVREDGEVLLDGGVLVEDINSRFDLALPHGDYDTIAGFIFSSLGRMPEEGDQILVDQSGAVSLGRTADIADTQDSDTNSSNTDDGVLSAACRLEIVTMAGHRIETVRMVIADTKTQSDTDEAIVIDETKEDPLAS